MIEFATRVNNGFSDYPLVNYVTLYNIAMEWWFIMIYSWFSHWKWWFSIAMLNYQRVSCFNTCLDLCDISCLGGLMMQKRLMFLIMTTLSRSAAAAIQSGDHQWCAFWSSRPSCESRPPENSNIEIIWNDEGAPRISDSQGYSRVGIAWANAAATCGSRSP